MPSQTQQPITKLLWRLSSAAVLLAVAFSGTAVEAQRLIPFQGRIAGADGLPIADGVYRVTFAIYDSQTGADPIGNWVEPHENVSIIGGQINVLLGSITSLDDPDGNGNSNDAISFAAGGTEPVGPRYLGIKIGEASNQEMVPRHELVPTFHARVADRVVKGGIDTEQLADGAVTTVKLDPRAGVPVGAVVMWWGLPEDVPEGFEICDGELPTTAGALLTGNKPDLRDRVPIGVDSGGTATTVGATGGVTGGSTGATALTVNELPSHTHAPSAHNHQTGLPSIDWGIAGPIGASTPYFVRAAINSNIGSIISVVQTSSNAIGDTNAIVGGDQAHTHERSAYIGMHFIIRVK